MPHSIDIGDLVQDGVGWFSSRGAAPGSFALRVTADLDAARRITERIESLLEVQGIGTGGVIPRP